MGCILEVGVPSQDRALSEVGPVHEQAGGGGLYPGGGSTQPGQSSIRGRVRHIIKVYWNCECWYGKGVEFSRIN